jgi:acetolactate synthase I/II/III large subunit
MPANAGSRGTDAVALMLKRAGVARVFALSGNHIMSVFDALFEAGIEVIHTRHEAAAVHMADAWSRVTGEPGIALVTGGPGHANAVSALYTAQMSETPVLLLSGHAPNDQAGAGAFQEIAQADMARPVTKAAWASRGSEQLAGDVASALQIAHSGRPGPVNLNMPSDALQGPADMKALPLLHAGAAVQRLDDGLATTVMHSLASASRPVIVAGPVLMSRTGRERLGALEHASGIPAIGMESPRGLLDPNLGAFAEMLAQADRILLLGKRLDFTMAFGKQPALRSNCEFLQVDPEQTEIRRSMAAVGNRLVVAAIADAFPAAEALRKQARGGKVGGGWLTEVKAAVTYRPSAWDTAKSALPGHLHPVELLRPLQGLLDSHPEAVLICDGGEIGQWAQACLNAPHRLINGMSGSIGAALPFAMGARFAQREAPILTVMGDGTFGFHAVELDTAVTHQLPFIAVVGNDARWNAEYQIQLREFGANRARGCEMRPLRYDLIAAAFGAHGENVADGAALLPALERAQASGRPAVINAPIEGLAAPRVRRTTASG